MKPTYLKKLTAWFLATALLFGVLPAGFIPAQAASGDAFSLCDGTALADLYVDEAQEYPQVLRAVGDLKSDIAEVTGQTPRVVSDAEELGSVAVIIGTVGHSGTVDALAADGKIDLTGITGQWEAFTIQMVAEPFAGIDSALVIAGSDMRGTIFGAYELSEQIGVSPWYWWGDVPIIKKSQVILDKTQIEMTDKPDVKYRGIFFNDEENFEYWSRLLENDTDSPGTPNANTYAKIFELMLRLKANTIWPAMHEQSDAFNAFLNPETGISYNAETADKYGVIAGSSHCEMLLRNNATEWVPWCQENAGKYNLQKVDNDWKASYDYTVNPTAMEAYWEEAVARNYKFDNMYTIGLRGVHDGPINCRNLVDKSIQGKAGVVKSAIEAQLRILNKYEEKYREETGIDKTFLKIYCSYKEAAEYFQYDISLPSDTIVIWADDNHGYVRQFGTAEQLNKFSGMGVYYHNSYLGAPVSYLWLATTPLGLIHEEMTKAYNAGSNDCWILNVGDLKPGEISTEFFLSMGWDHDRYTDQTIPEFLKMIAKRDFGVNDEDSSAIADILETYYAVSSAKRPEFFGKNQGPDYSLIQYGDEAQLQINRMQAACTKSDEIYNRLPAQYKDAYYQLVHYMVRASKLTLEKHIYQQKNQLYLNQGRFASVNAYADASMEAYRQILADLKYYNKTVSGGRWDGILDPYNSTRGLPTITGEPSLTYVSEDIAIEGIGSVCEGQNTGGEAVTLKFNALTDDKRFIDVFTTGLTACNYTITAGKMINLAKADGTAMESETAGDTKTFSGRVEVEERLIASVDWSKADAGTTNTTIRVTGPNGFDKTYQVQLTKPTIDPDSEITKGYYETNGEVAIEAEHYSSNIAVDGKEWKEVRGLGRGVTAMKNYPDLTGSSTRIDQNFETASPYLEYNIHFETTGTFDVSFYRVPTLNEGVGKTNRTAFQFDTGSIYLFLGNGVVGDEFSNEPWRSGVREHIQIMKHSITVASAGWHKIRIYCCDAGTAFDRIVLRNTAQDAKASVLGAPESFTSTAEYARPEIGTPPVFSLDDITYSEPDTSKKFLYDFSDNAAVVSTGYMGVDNKSLGSATKGYIWDNTTFANVKAFTRSVSKTSIRDQGFVYGNTDAALTINLPKAGKYVVGFTVGDPQTTGIAVNDMAITANGAQLLSGFSQAAGRVSEKGYVIDVTGAPHLRLEFSGSSWVLNALEIAPYTEPSKDNGTGAFRQDSYGNINIEAEAALENSNFAWIVQGSDVDQSKWTETYGSSGTAMYSGPNKVNNFNNTSYSSNSGPKMHYKIEFPQAGNYNMWVLAKSQSEDDDSILVSLDQSTGIVLNDTKDTGGGFKWFKVGSQINVPSAGEHVLSIWEREDGIVIDKVILTPGGSGPSGLGGKMCRAGATVDRTELDALIARVEGLNASDYLEDQFNAMQAVLAAVKALPGEATQNQIDTALVNLSDALNALVDRDVVDADIKTGLVAKYEFEGNWKNKLDESQTAATKVVGNATAPALQNDGERGGVVKLNPGGPSDYSKVSFPNPLYGEDIKEGLTVSYLAKGVSAGNYELWWTATDDINYVWLTGGLYMGYAGSRGYIDVNKDNSGAPGMKTNQWNMITVTITDTEMVLYINGKKYLSSAEKSYTNGYSLPDLSRVTDLIRQAKTLDLGGKTEYWGTGNFYADDFTVYNRALNANEAAKLALNPANLPPSITSIEVTTLPTKTVYAEGEAFDPAGMVVTAYYDDDTSETATGYTVSGYTSTPGTKTITVTYQGKTDTFEVTVNASQVKKGDVNDDGSINALDIMLVRKYMISGGSINTAAADMNDDDSINALDIMLIRKLLLTAG